MLHHVQNAIPVRIQDECSKRTGALQILGLLLHLLHYLLGLLERIVVIVILFLFLLFHINVLREEELSLRLRHTVLRELLPEDALRDALPRLLCADRQPMLRIDLSESAERVV